MLTTSSQALAYYRVAEKGGACVSVEGIEQQIRVFRGHPVLLDSDLARICGVPAQRLLDQLSRHEPLVGELCFAPERDELAPSGEASPDRPLRRYAFTEHGAFMAAILLKTPEAIAMSVQIVRAFVRHRERPANHETLVPRLVRGF